MANQYGTYVQGNLFRGNYKKPGGTMYTPRSGYSKAENIGYDAAYYGGLAYGLYQGRETLGAAAGALGRGIVGLAQGAAEVAPEAIEMGMLIGAPMGI